MAWNEERQKRLGEKAAEYEDKPLGAAVMDDLEQVGNGFTQIFKDERLAPVMGAIGFVATKVKDATDYAKDVSIDENEQWLNHGTPHSPVGVVGNTLRAVDFLSENAAEGSTAILQAGERAIEPVVGEIDDRVAPAIGNLVPEIAKEIAVERGLGLVGRVLRKGTPPPPGSALPGAQQPQLAYATAGPSVGTTVAQPQLDNHVWRLSKHDDEFYAHGKAKQGMAEEYSPHFEKLNKDFDNYQPWTRQWTERISQMPPVHGIKDPTAYRARIRLYRDRVNGVVSKDQFVKLDPEAVAGDLKQMLDQHHLFPVTDSAAFVSKMVEMIRKGKADNDDLLNMFMYADYMGATMGHSWRNMLNMSQKPHKAIHDMYTARGQKLYASLDGVKSSNDLHKRLKEHIVERVLPSKKDAIKLQLDHLKSLSFPEKQEYLAELIEFKTTFEKQLTKQQKSAYDEYIEALQLRGA